MPPHRWLILNFDNKPIDKILTDANIYLRSDVTAIERTANESSFRIFQYYKISPNKPALITENYGFWNLNQPHNIIDDRTSPIISRRRYNLQKSILRATHVSIFKETTEGEKWRSYK